MEDIKQLRALLADGKLGTSANFAADLKKAPVKAKVSLVKETLQPQVAYLDQKAA